MECLSPLRILRYILLLVPGLALGAAQAADRSECVEQVRLHGLLSAARPVCPLTHYSKMFQYKAESCEAVLGRADYRRLLSEGKTALDARIQELGREAVCSKIRKDFPWTVR